MKLMVPRVVEMRATEMSVHVPNRYAGDEDDPMQGISPEAPYRDGMLHLVIDMTDGKVTNWAGPGFKFDGLKVCDEGRYTLEMMDEHGLILVMKDDCYVPPFLGGGDYLDITIDDDGYIHTDSGRFDPKKKARDISSFFFSDTVKSMADEFAP